MSNAFDLMFVRTQHLPTFVDHRKNSSIRTSLKPNTIFVINPKLNSSLDMALGVILTIQNIALVLQERRCKPSKKAKLRHCAIREDGLWLLACINCIKFETSYLQLLLF
jgi:hypothetical protein